jgi:hypothetical protein
MQNTQNGFVMIEFEKGRMLTLPACNSTYLSLKIMILIVHICGIYYNNLMCNDQIKIVDISISLDTIFLIFRFNTPKNCTYL